MRHLLRRNTWILTLAVATALTQARGADAGSTPALENLRAASYEFLQRGDFVRALRVAYLVREKAPTDPNASFLLGVIYDEGLDRPELAIPEYEKALALRPWSDLPDRLRERVHYLRRRSVEKAALTSGLDAPQMFTKKEVAFFPFGLSGPAIPDPDLLLGLTDLAIQDLSIAEGGELRLHLTVAGFQKRFPEAGAVEFAKWSGAGRTLTGKLDHLGEGDVRLNLRLIGSDGDVLYDSPALSANLLDLKTLHSLILTQAWKALASPPPADLPNPDIRSPITLTLHGKALKDYLEGRLEEAIQGFKQVGLMEPRSKLAKIRLRSARLDAAGAAIGGSLVDAYQTALQQPNTDEALLNRLRATHRLSGMGSGAESGEETLNPYKPPRNIP